MEPDREEQPQGQPPPSAKPRPKRFRMVKEERFRIVKLEERIAPKKSTSGGPTCAQNTYVGCPNTVEVNTCSVGCLGW